MKTDLIVEEWSSIPNRIRKSIDGLTDTDLLVRGGSEGWSIAEYVHHVVEANLIAAHIVLAALGKPGYTYDWSWLAPDREWMVRLSYDRAPIQPALRLFEALTAHISSLLSHTPGALAQRVDLIDVPGKVPRNSTVAKVLREEIAHATNHIHDIESAKRPFVSKIVS